MRVDPSQSFVRKTLVRSALIIGIIVSISALGFSNHIPSWPSSISPKEAVISKQTNSPKIEVLMTKGRVMAGSYIDESNIFFSAVAVEILPEDPISSWNEIKGKVTLSTLSKGTIISKAQLGQPIALIPAVIEPEEIPVEVAIKAIEAPPAKKVSRH